MAEDREILREVWDGRIPVCFRLAVDEITRINRPDPCYLMVPRTTYFPLVTDNIYKEHADEHSEMWLDYNGQPLKWHYPVGVLFDLYGLDALLPWNLTVHFKNFPQDDLLHCTNRAAVESHFMSMVKEADALKHRGQVINSMQKKDHGQLWLGLQNDKFDQFWAVNKKLMDIGNEDGFKSIPFRIYMVDQMWVQCLVRPTKSNGEPTVLEDLLSTAVPELTISENQIKFKVKIHGIEPPLDTPIQWMSEHMSYPDNFLHLCIVPFS